MIEWLNTGLYFIVSFFASIVGAVGGVGSGLIVKPILELAIPLPAAIASLYSALAVFFMAFTAFIRQRKAILGKDGIKMDVAIPLSVGSVVGGIIGNFIFKWINDIMGGVDVAQGVAMIAVMALLLLHQIFESKIKPLNLKGAPIFLLLGTVLGVFAVFLGIGGGPLNLFALTFFAALPLKIAALYSIFIIMFAQGTSLLRWAIPFEPWGGGGWPLGHEKVAIYLIVTVVIASVAGALIGSGWYNKIKNNPKGNSILKKVYCGVLIFVILISAWNLYSFLCLQ